MIIPTSLYWMAIRDGYQMNGHNPIELLGLVAIYEEKKAGPNPEPYRWSVSGPDVYQELMDQAFPDDQDATATE
ncbi:MAG TPA: hypothetical protein VJX67_03520 [Blastocatellia bacterium]|nr:hypothetical protein [Blastocatellia bacterium]